MFNLNITVDTDSNPPCFHVPKNTPMVDLVSFFEALGFELKVNNNPLFAEIFLDVANRDSGESVAWLMLTGTHLKVVK